MLKEAIANLARFPPSIPFFSGQVIPRTGQQHQVCDKNGVPGPADSGCSATPPPPPYEKIDSDIDVSHAHIESGTLDAKLVKQSASLLQLAPEMPHTMAMDLCMVSLDKMVAALPLESDPRAKALLWKKLQEITDRYRLNVNSGPAASHHRDSSDFVVRAAVALKASPVPDFMFWAFSSMLQALHQLDQTLCIQQRIWNMLSNCIATIINLDNQYDIHCTAGRFIYTCFTTVCKACIAYTEAPGYNESKKHA